MIPNSGEFLTPTDYRKLEVAGSGKLIVLPPKEVTAAQEVFPFRQYGIFRRRIQNVGTSVIKILLVKPLEIASWPSALPIITDMTPDYATAIPHIVLPGGTVDYDGLGGAAELDKFGDAVYVWSGTSAATAFKVILFEAYLDYVNS